MIEVKSNLQALRRMAVMTTISVLISFSATFLAMAWTFGTDPNAIISVKNAFSFGLTNAIVLPVLICPIICYRIVMVIRDRDHAQVELRRLADTDQLTGLLNRRGFDSASSAATTGRPVQIARSVLMIDIDNFKNLNDRYGHEFGDRVLAEIGAILRMEATKDGLIVGRQGGEEFVALLIGTDNNTAVMIAERIRKSCSEVCFSYQAQLVTVTVSLGLSTRMGSHPLSQIIAEADNALYRAKQAGRDRTVVFESVMPFTHAA